MTDFIVDKRLQKDTILLHEDNNFCYLLMNNKLVKWFILVPKTQHKEIYLLEKEQQLKCYQTIETISEFIQSAYQPDKLNTAAIGNIVEQLHIHIIGRYHNDPYWPGVVWGNPLKKSYQHDESEKIRKQFTAIF